MRPRFAVLLVPIAVVALASAAFAAPPAVDGRRVIGVDFSGSPRTSLQPGALLTIGTSGVGAGAVDPATCKPPICDRHPVAIRPARGVKANLNVTVTWSSPVSDFDLYLLTPSGSTLHCGSRAGSTSEAVGLPAARVRPGTYTVVLVNRQVVQDGYQGKLRLPGVLPEGGPTDFDRDGCPTL